MTAGTEEPAQRLLQTDLIAPGPLRSLERAWQIFRYYRKRQLLARAWKITAGRWSIRRTLPQFTHVQLREEAWLALRQLFQFRSTRVADGLVSPLHELNAGTFILLGERRALGRPVKWSGSAVRNAERLWGFQLQYQEYLLDAAAIGGDEGWSIVAGLLDDWLQAYSRTHVSTSDDAWHPYCISRRTPVWLMLLAQDRLPLELTKRMLVSLAVQMEWLQRNCETDLGGNHLLENAHALALTGLTFIACRKGRDQVPQEWLKRAQTILEVELPKQVLLHGEHFERSPMYHAHVLGNLLQVAIVARAGAPELAQTCCDWALPMWEFLKSILHADGEIPLFGDSCFGESYPVAQLGQLMLAAKAIDGQRGSVDAVNSPIERLRTGSASPYWVWRNGNDRWIVDGGAAVENTLPAHGHCDLAGFEASIEGERWFVDAGVFGYSDDFMRHYCRSSVAHNVATIDNRNQFDVWSRFRMGYRVQPYFETGNSDGFRWAHISHTAYRRVGSCRLHRIVAITPSLEWVCIDQCVYPLGRSLMGNLHLSPGVSAEHAVDGSWVLKSRRHRRILRFFGTNRVECGQSWYAPRFGVRQLINCLHYEASAGNLTGIAWLLSKESTQRHASVRFERRGSKTVEVVVKDQEGKSCKWDLDHSACHTRKLNVNSW